MDNETDADPEDRIEGGFNEPLEVSGYELTHRPEHLGAAEQAWPEDEQNLVQWDNIYSEVETFLSSDQALAQENFTLAQNL